MGASYLIIWTNGGVSFSQNETYADWWIAYGSHESALQKFLVRKGGWREGFSLSLSPSIRQGSFHPSIIRYFSCFPYLLSRSPTSLIPINLWVMYFLMDSRIGSISGSLSGSPISGLWKRCVRFSVFRSKSCVFLAVCGQIWEFFLETYDLKS